MRQKRTTNRISNLTKIALWAILEESCYFCNLPFCKDNILTLTIHHADHNRSNNTKSNLKLSHRTCHKSYHMKHGHDNNIYMKGE